MHMNKPRWAHQIAAVERFRNIPAGMLALEMGTGKSRCAIDWIEAKGLQRILLIAPKNVVDYVWPGQFDEWATEPLTVVSLNTKFSVAKKRDQLETALAAATEERLVITANYDSVWRSPLKELIATTPWDAAVMDESQRIKAAGSKISWFCKNLSGLVPNRLCLTGTPLAQRPLDLYGQFRFLDPTIFGTNFNKFKHRYGVFQSWQNVEILRGYQNMEEFKEKMFSITMRVEADDVLDLPDKVFVNRYCDMAPSTTKIYRALQSTLVAECTAGTTTAANAIVKAGKLDQMSQGFTKHDDGLIERLDDSKLRLLADVLTDLDEPVVIYCEYHEDLDRVHEACHKLKLSTSELSGRLDTAEQWMEGKTDVLVAQADSGTVGISLVRARVIIYYSLSRKLASYTQSQARIRRPGQTSDKCLYVHLLTKDSIDEVKLTALTNMEDVNQAILRGLGYAP